MSKQDRQGVRTARDLEQKYGFGKSFSEVKESLKVATETAEQAEKQALKAHSEVLQLSDSIKLEVDNGETTAQIKLKVGDKEIPATIDMKGLVTFANLANADGTTVINGSNITTGQILADLIKAGTIKSKDGTSLVLNLDEGTGKFTGQFYTVNQTENTNGESITCYSRMTPTNIMTHRNNNNRVDHQDVTLMPGHVAVSKTGADSGIYGGEAFFFHQSACGGLNKISLETTDNSTVLEMIRINEARQEDTLRIALGEGAEFSSPVDIKAPNFKGTLNGYDALHAYGWWSYNSGQNVDDLNNGYAFVYGTHGAVTTGPIISFGNNGYHTQLQSNYQGHGLFYRNLNGDNGTWKQWYTLIDSGNIGSQSVSNADMLDGYHASSFVPVAAPTNLLHSGNEFTYAPDGYSGTIWHNYRTANWDTNGNITGYYFGNGKGSTAGVTLYADNFSGKLNGRKYKLIQFNVPSYSTSGSNGYNYYGDVSVSGSFGGDNFSTTPCVFLQCATPTTGVIALEPVSYDYTGVWSIRIHRSSSASNVAGFTVYCLAVL